MLKRSKNDTYLDKSELRSKLMLPHSLRYLNLTPTLLINSILIKGDNAWNNLSVEIRSINSYENFKLTLKKWLCSMIPN